MLVFNIVNVKGFMSDLLKNSTFDLFEVRLVNIQTFTTFEINGILDKDFFTLDEQDELHRNYCLWSEIKPFAFQMIKGSRLPKTIKLIFSVSNKEMVEICEKASAMFLNITFENGIITCMTGSSQKDFSFDKSVEYSWDAYVNEFFSKNNIMINSQI